MIEHIIIPEERMEILKTDKRKLTKLRKFVKAKVTLEDCVVIECDDPIMSLRLKEVFHAFGRGFDFEEALNLLDEEFVLEVLEIKEFAGKSRKRQIELKGRVIGREGKIRKMIEKETETKMAVYGKTVALIGKWPNVQKAKESVQIILSGGKHNTVYRFLKEGKR